MYSEAVVVSDATGRLVSTSYCATLARRKKKVKSHTNSEPRSVQLVEYDVTNANTDAVSQLENQIPAVPNDDTCVSCSRLDRHNTNDNDTSKPHGDNGCEHEKTNS